MFGSTSTNWPNGWIKSEFYNTTVLKFSIITPSYNQGRFLPDCIDSVLSQEGVEVEHIVTDAGSTDQTVEVLKQYRGSGGPASRTVE